MAATVNYLDMVEVLARTVINEAFPVLRASYDQEGDVFYIQFAEGVKADNSEFIEDDVVVRYKDDKVVGITILNASKWSFKRNSVKLEI
ncbi:MAG: DUF2283 domain-containing protein [Syntrophomonadaceae bacterium]|jgi:uncharacterized protein YuzE